MRAAWSSPIQHNASIAPIREAFSESTRIAITEARKQVNGPAFMWLKVSLVDEPVSLDIYIDNGELYYSVNSDVEWGPVPVGSRGLQVAFLTGRLDAKAAEIRASGNQAKGLTSRSASGWKTTKRGTSTTTYHVPPQSPENFHDLRAALGEIPEGFLAEAHLKKPWRGMPAFQLELRQVLLVVVFEEGGDIFYLIPSIRESEVIPVGSVNLQVQFLLERVQAAEERLRASGD